MVYIGHVMKMIDQRNFIFSPHFLQIVWIMLLPVEIRGESKFNLNITHFQIKCYDFRLITASVDGYTLFLH